MREVLVIVLDGISPSITLSLSELFDDIKWFKRRYRWRVIHINQPPTTSSVLMTMFTGLRYDEHKIWWFNSIDYNELCNRFKFVWDEAEERGLKVIVSPLPITWKPIHKNFKIIGKLKTWELIFPDKGKIFETISELHKNMVINIKSNWNLFISYYPIPDKLYHVTSYGITEWEHYYNMIKAYALSFRYARDLINKSNPKRWLIVGDHGYLCPSRFIRGFENLRRTLHTPETIFISNIHPPVSIKDVYYWIRRWLCFVK